MSPIVDTDIVQARTGHHSPQYWTEARQRSARLLAANDVRIVSDSWNGLEPRQRGITEWCKQGLTVLGQPNDSRTESGRQRKIWRSFSCAYLSQVLPVSSVRRSSRSCSPRVIRCSNTLPGQPATEDAATVSSAAIPRAASEEATTALAAEGVNTSVVRLPQVHDTAKQGLVTYAISVFREKGVCAYIGDGLNRWPAAHILDVARLYRLALEKAAPGAKYHAVAETGVSMRDIAETLGRRLNLPVKSISREEADAFFGWLAMFAAHDMPALSEQTRKSLGWQPTGPGLIADLEQLRVV
jgi:hypothetical protein